MSALHTPSEFPARTMGPHYCLFCNADWPCAGSRMEAAERRSATPASPAAPEREGLVAACEFAVREFRRLGREQSARYIEDVLAGRPTGLAALGAARLAPTSPSSEEPDCGHDCRMDCRLCHPERGLAGDDR